MTRVFSLIGLFLLISKEILGQCANPPRITLSSTGGIACGTAPVTVSGNTFSGLATMVMISENGKGSVSQIIFTKTPFTFTYTPEIGDLGKKITIIFTSNDPEGRSCRAAKVTYTLTVNTLPDAPGKGTVIQPTCWIPKGSVILKDLPGSGTWTLTRIPGGSTTGTGITTTVTGLDAGKYNFRVATSDGCVSDLSEDVEITPPPSAPKLMVADPPPVCFPSTVNLTDSRITAGSGTGLMYTYWRNADADRIFFTPTTAAEGTYYIKATSENGCYDVKPVKVTVKHQPEADAGPDRILNYQFRTNMDALRPDADETGKWSVLSGSGLFSDNTNARADVSNLALGKNIYLWTITNGVCPPSADTVTITVLDLMIPTLITPNMDGRNDYLVIGSNEMTGKMELVIFNRQGVQVYKNLDYDNRWNGIDTNENPLPDGTYFYLLKTENGKSASGFIVIRR